VQEILSYLQKTGWKVGLASSSSKASVVKNLERADLTSFFQTLTTGDMVEHSKPKPDIYLMACKELGVEPKDAYAIEDSPNGIRAAHGAGMCPIMVPDLVQPDEEMRSLSSYIFKDLLEVRAFFEKGTK
jgi:HAD superfamily hydrolase (TIGR01509 family)